MVIHQIDQIDAARREAVMAVVKVLNPVADIVVAEHGRMPMGCGPKDRWPPPGSPQRQAIESRWKAPWGDRLNEVVFIGCDLDRAAIEQAWKAAHLTFTETRKGIQAWADLPDPFPKWARAVDG